MGNEEEIYMEENRDINQGDNKIDKNFILAIIGILITLWQIIDQYTLISYMEAYDLMNEYGNAYEYALKYKAEYMDAESNDDKDKIEEKALINFKKILSPKALDIVEYSIFKNTDEVEGYMDVKKYDYNEFEYTNNIEVSEYKKEIIVKDSYFVKTSRGYPKKEEKWGIPNQVFTYSRKNFFGEPIIEDCNTYKDN